jgi:cytoskeletal protein CcmA (bactofilin family)
MTEPKTIVGASTVIKGNIEGDEILIVEGRIEGAISLSKPLLVEPSGVVQADIAVESAVIRGALVGNIQAQESVHIEAGGRVIGDINAPRVVLDDGAAFKGGIDMGDFDIEQDIEPEPPRPRVEGAPAPSAFAPPAAEAVPEPRLSRRPQPRSRTSIPLSKPAAEPMRSMAPVPRVRTVGRTKAKKRGF